MNVGFIPAGEDSQMGQQSIHSDQLDTQYCSWTSETTAVISSVLLEHGTVLGLLDLFYLGPMYVAVPQTRLTR